MNSMEIKEKLSSIGIHAIQIEGSANRERSGGLVFIGNLEEYLTALQCVGAKFVFQVNEFLEDEDFLYSPEGDDGDEDDEEEEVDLVKIKPALAKFKTYIGQQCRFRLFTPVATGTLDYFGHEDWWGEFEELWSEAIESVNESKEKEEARIQDAQSQKEQKIIKDIQALIKDKDFISLPTQRAMLEFAKENIPGADELDPHLLKEEIRTLDAKIKARRLSRK